MRKLRHLFRLSRNEYKICNLWTGDSDDWLKKVSKENENVIFLGS